MISSEIAGEEWRPVVGFESDFEVSDLGRVRRLYAGGANGFRILKPTPHGSANSYLVLNLSKDGARAIGRRHKPGDYEPGRSKYFKVHLLVLEAFRGARPDGMQGCHNDGDGFNNRLDNLRWGTWESNIEDMIVHGRRKGAKNGRSKLTEAQARELQAIGKEKDRPTWTKLGELYGVSGTQARNVALSLSGGWRHLAVATPTSTYKEHHDFNSEQKSA